jgi:TonB family protein
MKIKLLALALIATIKVNAQTKQVESYNKDIDKTEVYMVSGIDTGSKEGAFKQYQGIGKVISTDGYYHNNLKDSLWKYYYREDLVAEGHYKADKKTGVWTGYTRGFERLKYDFTTRELLLYVPATIDTVQTFRAISSSADTIFDRRPIYINGMLGFANNLLRQIRYPAIARESNKVGEVIIAFTIDEEGNATNFTVKKKLGYGLEDEVLRVIKQNDGVWVPAILKGKPVAVQCEIPILFELGDPDNSIRYKPNQIIIRATKRRN